MKLITFLNYIISESVGVPNNITQSSKKLFDSIIKKLEPIIGNNTNIKEFEEINILIEDSFIISDMILDEISVELSFIDYSSIQIVKLYVNKSPSARSLPHIEYNSSKELDLGIVIAVDSDTTGSDVLDFMIKNKSELVSLLSHEIMHEYHFSKKNKNRIEKFIEYKSSQKNIGSIQIITNFLFSLYYFHEFENAVRPSEVYSELVEIGTTKQSFLPAIKKNRVFKEINYFKNLKYQDLIEELREHKSTMYNILKLNEFDVDDLSLDELIQFFLYILRKVMIRWRSEIAREVFFDNPIDLFSSLFFKTKSELLYNKFINKITSGGLFSEEEYDSIKSPKNNEIFYTKRLNSLNKTSEILFRRLSKIYSLLPDENDNVNTLNKKINRKNL